MIMGRRSEASARVWTSPSFRVRAVLACWGESSRCGTAGRSGAWRRRRWQPLRSWRASCRTAVVMVVVRPGFSRPRRSRTRSSTRPTSAPPARPPPRAASVLPLPSLSLLIALHDRSPMSYPATGSSGGRSPRSTLSSPDRLCEREVGASFRVGRMYAYLWLGRVGARL